MSSSFLDFLTDYESELFASDSDLHVSARDVAAATDSTNDDKFAIESICRGDCRLSSELQPVFFECVLLLKRRSVFYCRLYLRFYYFYKYYLVLLFSSNALLFFVGLRFARSKSSNFLHITTNVDDDDDDNNEADGVDG